MERDHTKMYGGKPAVKTNGNKNTDTLSIPYFREAVEPNYTKMYGGKTAVKTDGSWSYIADHY